ncbi:facilitated trehalose transporter Tret1-2 homolog [Macrosteles quadrilineatus]|uniref:facilitated trehalose transporter Tret1-2 homolog n=1 Tax=Macrosteles quadrilineatus TaxID=74068 RepID=UPI0023E13B65|nr:facilitated trehalose transporter Tret1-2 homolog [Macrosteles quadrilineatus]
MTTSDSKTAAFRRTAKFRQYMAAFIANLSAFSIGTMLGWTSPMQPLLSSAHPPIGSEPLSAEFISWLGSINFIGALCGTLFWGILSDRLGRKHTAIIVAVPFIIAWLLKIVAQNGWWLLVARIIIGIGCSGVIINTPIYVTEMAEDKIRGSLGSYLMIFLNAGCVFSYIIGSLTSYHGLAAICLCVPIIFLVTFPNLPESPVYLWTHGKKTEAENSLLWFRGGNTLQTMKEIENLQQKTGKAFEKPCFRDLFDSKGVKKALFISISFVVGQQFCGILAILTYTVKIFQDSGSSLSAHNSMIIVGVLQLSSAFTSSLLVDRAGRRVLLIMSYFAMAVSLTVLGCYLYFQDDSWNPLLKWIPITCLSVNVVFYSIGVGPVPFVVISEIFPPNIRGFAMSKIQMLGTTLSFASVKTFPTLTNLLGSHGCFLFYASFCLILTLFTFLYVPETKGKSLQAILKQLNGEELTKAEESEYTELYGTQQSTIVKKQNAATA